MTAEPIKYEPHNPHIPCELQGGHDWKKVSGKNINEAPVSLEFCVRCGKVKA